jgi:hypothetical protein
MTNIEELKKKEKSLIMTTGILAGIITVMIIVSIFSTIKKGIDFFTFLPMFFLPMLVLNYKNIKKIKSKIKLEEE